MADKPGELNNEAVIQPKLLPQLLAVGEAGVHPDHAIDRVADKIEQCEGNKSDSEHHQHGLIKTLQYKGEHRFDAKPAI